MLHIPVLHVEVAVLGLPIHGPLLDGKWASGGFDGVATLRFGLDRLAYNLSPQAQSVRISHERSMFDPLTSMNRELFVLGGTAGTSVSSTDQRRVDSWQDRRIHPAGSGAEEEAIRT